MAASDLRDLVVEQRILVGLIENESSKIQNLYILIIRSSSFDTHDSFMLVWYWYLVLCCELEVHYTMYILCLNYILGQRVPSNLDYSTGPCSATSRGNFLG